MASALLAVDNGVEARLYWKLSLLSIERWTRLLRLVWAVAVVVVIVGSLLPADSSAIRTISELPVNDKVQHGLAYAVLALLPVLHERLRTAAVILVLVAALGVALEFGQLYSPGRSFDTQDMMADLAGEAVGAVIGLFLRRLLLPGVN